ncbi:MAG TPA: ACP phosphodiesterase [Cyclobacteriaceae bacterium]|nr:ACP phosphodiesterase [Cyclobacteriaceae bacterium]
MNFLGHLYLSGENENIITGNFMGDFVKGKEQLKQYHDEIVRGIMLHRSIDQFTDAHPAVAASKERLRPKYRHYAGVIVDVFYDHFLAKNWERFHHKPLHEYSQYAYGVIRSSKPILPEEARHMLPYMIQYDWLYNYRTIEGINRALTGMSRRTSFESHMQHASKDLEIFYDEFSKEFSAFLPEIEQHCKDWLSTK